MDNPEVAEKASNYMKKVKNMRRFRLKKWIRTGNMVFVIVRTPAPAALWKDKSRRMFHLAREHIGKRGNKVWLEDGRTGKKLMLDEMERSTKAVSKALKERGLKPGQVVAMVDMSRLETPILALATWLCGGVFNTMDPNPAIATLKANLEAMPPAILITSTGYAN